MRAITFGSLCGLLLCMGVGCATEPAYIPLTPEQSQQVGSSNSVILATQKELNADIDKSNVSTYTGGGLIFALVDVAVENSRANSAEALLKPIRDTLNDFEMGKELRQALGSRLDTIAWLHLKNTEVVYDNKPDQVASLLAAGQGDVLLLITPTYALTSDFSALRVESEIKVVPRATHLISAENAKDEKKRMTPFYKTNVSHLAPLTVAGTVKEEAAKAWAADGGARIRQAMKQGVTNLADKIVEALNHPEQSLTAP